MRKKGLPAAAVFMVAAGLVLAGAAARPAPSADLSPSVPTDLPVAIQNLIATDVLPADVSGEPGVWNFAGAASACPGPGWVCTTPGVFGVVQKGTVNVLQVATEPQEACPQVTQQGLVNIMQCEDEEKAAPIAHQTCGTAGAPILQGPSTAPGADPRAYNTLICKLYYDVQAAEEAEVVGSPPVMTQCVLQEAHFDQSGTTNEFKGEFRAVQQQVSGAAQRQQARQRINGLQDADEWNKSEVEETQIQKLSGSARLQFQNDQQGCPGVAKPITGLGDDCNNEGSTGPANPYTCIQLDQDVCCEPDPKNENISKLKAEVRQEAVTKAVGTAVPPAAGSVTQQQGERAGGNDGDIHQELPFGSPGRNLNIAHQYTYQKLVSPTTDTFTEQIQIEDPFCCTGSSRNGENNEEAIDQTVLQEATGDPNPDQDAEAEGRGSSESQGDFLLPPEETVGSCKVTVNHYIENRGGNADTSQTDEGDSCSVEGTTSCTSGTPGDVEDPPRCESTNCPEDEPFNPESGRCEEPAMVTTTTNGFAPSLSAPRP
jgi:hypothetical protein